MGKPKKQSSERKTGQRRSQLVLELAKRVNSRLSHAGSKVKATTTKRDGSGRVKKAAKKTAKAAK